MKNQFFATVIISCLAIALAAPGSSPAGSTKKNGNGKSTNQAPPPKKEKKAAPPKKSPPPAAAPPAPNSPATPLAKGNLNLRAPALVNTSRLGIMLREPGGNQIASQEVCLYQSQNFGGWKYCSNLKGLQELPARYHGQTTSMTVPDGYLVRLYQRTDRTGVQCVFYGQVGQVARDCDNITAAISLETDPEWPAKQAAAQRQRELEAAEEARQAQARERQAEAERVAEVQRQQQEAQAQREREVQEAQANEEAQARRERQAARDAELRIARRRQAEIEAHKCLALFSTDDGDFNPLNPLAVPRAFLANSRCANETEVYNVGAGWSDNIEMVQIKSPWVRVTIYEDDGYRGRRLTLTCGLYELIDDPENEATSYKIEIMDAPVACRDRSQTNLYNWDR